MKSWPQLLRSRGFRRRAFLYGLLVAPALMAGYGWTVGRSRLRVRHERLSDRPEARFVHLTDLHHKCDTALLRRVVTAIRRIAPEFVCFTGDLVEETAFLPETLAALAALGCPVFGVPGNHDYWSGADFGRIDAALRATGGRWLVDEQAEAPGARVLLSGHSATMPAQLRPATGRINVALVHYPAEADRLAGVFDLVLAGHSHGGQVRLPGVGALILPDRVGRYDLGRFQTPGGPLHVSAGVGTFHFNVRFGCPPEVVVMEV
ncbi:MAG TPA: metallophosphoesterase [Verrucomicrobiota bacterium]|nr:metallophosphoesterase [Verrucomicrobiota bacterium]